MSVKLVTGTMGGGKTMYCVEQAWDAWQRGSMVIDNFKWRPAAEKFRELHRVLPNDPALWVRKGEDGQIESDIIVRGTEQTPNIVMIDEAYIYLGIHDQLVFKNRNRTLLEFCAMSRQLGLIVLFISQSADNIDVGVRKIAAHHVHCVNNDMIPGMGKLAGLVNGKFTRIYKSPQKGLELSRENVRFRPEIGELYNTHGQGDDIKVATHVGVVAVKPRMGSKLRFLLLTVPAAGLVAWYLWHKRAEPVHVDLAKPAMISSGKQQREESSAVIAYFSDPRFTLLLDDGSTLSLDERSESPVSIRRRRGGFEVRYADKETFHPLKK